MLFVCILLLLVADLNPSEGANLGKDTNVQERRELSTGPRCGQSNLDNSQTSPNAQNEKASVGNFPWAAMIFQKEDGVWKSFCAGTLVSSRVILTVAHCLKYEHYKKIEVAAQDLVVGLGRTNREWNSSEITGQNIAVKEVRIHPQFLGTSDSYRNDIALLILENDVVTNIAIMPACLDLINKHATDISANTKGYVTIRAYLIHCSECHSGDGDLKYTRAAILDKNTCYNNIKALQPLATQGITPDKFCSESKVHKGDLKYTRAAILDKNTCYNNIKALQPLATQGITPDKFCSESKVHKGDSGVGLTFSFNNSHYLYGIASNIMRFKKDEKEITYSLFSNVSYHLDWIKENLNK